MQSLPTEKGGQEETICNLRPSLRKMTLAPTPPKTNS